MSLISKKGVRCVFSRDLKLDSFSLDRRVEILDVFQDRYPDPRGEKP